MTIEEFNKLDEWGQNETCHDHSPYVAERYEGTVQVQLYLVGDFYAEIRSDDRCWYGIQAFKSIDRLQPYLNQFNTPML